MKTTHRQNAAFTLVELMVVIGIIMLLMGMLLYGVHAARVRATQAKMAGLINAIQNAIMTYQQDMADYPYSHFTRDNPRTSVNDTTLAGAELLVRAIIAPGPESEDGYDGPGFRKRFTASGNWVGRKYGPYLELTKLNIGPVRTTGGGDSQKVIRDSKDNPILYYRANAEAFRNAGEDIKVRDIYRMQDNQRVTPGSRGAFDDNLESFERYMARKYINGGRRSYPYNPESFILIGAGLDGIFGTEDDLTNFK